MKEQKKKRKNMGFLQKKTHELTLVLKNFLKEYISTRPKYE